ncbi:RHS repeat-associated core domain-containing protein [Pseudomonas sp. Marseille-P9899]|uniref:RHS repeat-associated core domain-containing protein n=1 Tax=Pseudomonas sp. Marseille-P9899 TaxID=2730401 RepID=UPI00158F5AF5|nr:RHS repeat-associated core domain-containing protein [Pseudomonas sp. Marseille-P9899]
MRSATHLHTPDLSVGDSLGRPLRQVAYCRDTPEQAVERRVTLSRYDAAGQWSRQWDPRLFQRLDQDDSVPPSQALLSSLSGKPLWLESADAGWRLTLFGDAGQPLENWDSRDSHWHTEYDALLRPVLIGETAAGQPARVAERFSYGGSEESANNRCGRLLRHDDEAGSRMIPGYSLGGAEQGEIRHFLTDLDLSDWPAAIGERDALLEPGDGARTDFLHGPLGDVLEQTDALANRHSSRFNLAGELASITLRLEDGSEHELLSDVGFNAFGQIETQTAGNGVISLAHYDPADGRLQRLSASRPERGALQDLIYAYDRVGNVLRIEDLSLPVSHFSNQKIDPVSTFRYDSLYRLVEATGREAAGALISPELPPLTPAPGDTSRLLNYRQHYEYDASGNLLSLKHIGWQAYTRHMAVADDSNHALPWVDSIAPENPRAGFDGNGNLLHLHAGQPLRWNARNQLHSTRQVAREGGEHDEEHYRYGGDGLRVRKVTTRLVGGRQTRSEVRYLPGLELRNRNGERLSVINVQAGRCAVRGLHWLEGKPDSIETPQLRYSLGDHLDSSTLELNDQARIISHEGYYPFGGTAWWAAHSAVEAGFKVRRYAGKERDASGLYDYGLRYYAPWLARWINPDPAGDVDGLNLFCMVANNPITLTDHQGLSIIHALGLMKPADNARKTAAIGRRHTEQAINAQRRFSAETQEILSSAKLNSEQLQKMKPAKRQAYLRDRPDLITEGKLKTMAAHAGAVRRDSGDYYAGFTNFPGSVSAKNPFPGVTLINRQRTVSLKLSQYVPETTAPLNTSVAYQNDVDYYLVSNSTALLNGVKKAYADNGFSLHPFIERSIRQHIENNSYTIPVNAGIPGLHAEVQAINALLNLSESESINMALSETTVFTERLTAGRGYNLGASFPACFNCNGILPSLVDVVTGRLSPKPKSPLRTRSGLN